MRSLLSAKKSSCRFVLRVKTEHGQKHRTKISRTDDMQTSSIIDAINVSRLVKMQIMRHLTF